MNEPYPSYEFLKCRFPQEVKTNHGRAFERYCSLVLPIVGLGITKVWRREDSLDDLPNPIAQKFAGRDKGIDLIARDQDGKYRVVQCKTSQSLRGSQGNLKTHSTDRVFAEYLDLESKCPDLLEGIIYCTNPPADRVQWDDQTSPRDRIPFLICDNYRFFLLLREIQPLLDPVSAETEEFALRPYQRKTIKKMKPVERGKLVMFCGAGKSTMSVSYAKCIRKIEQLWKKQGSVHVLVVAPTISLIGQFHHSALKHLGSAVPCFGFCTKSQGLESSTKIERLRTFCQRESGIVLTTLKSAAKIRALLYEPIVDGVLIELDEENRFYFDCLFVDEAHRLAGEKPIFFDEKELDFSQKDFRPYASCLVTDFPLCRQRFFLTATPLNSSSGLSMDDESLFGPELINYPLFQGVKDGYATPWVIHTLQTENSYTTPGQLSNWEHAKLLNDIFLEQRAKKVIVFCSKRKQIDEIKAMVEQLQTEEIPFHDITSEDENGNSISLRQREETRRKVEVASKAILWNIQICFEGIDIPSADGVYFACNVQESYRLYQAVGRITRLSPGKHLGGIFVPVTFDGEGKISQSNSWLLRTIASMAEMDQEFSRALESGGSTFLSQAFAHRGRDYGILSEEFKIELFHQLQENHWGHMFNLLGREIKFPVCLRMKEVAALISFEGADEEGYFGSDAYRNEERINLLAKNGLTTGLRTDSNVDNIGKTITADDRPKFIEKIKRGLYRFIERYRCPSPVTLLSLPHDEVMEWCDRLREMIGVHPFWVEGWSLQPENSRLKVLFDRWNSSHE